MVVYQLRGSFILYQNETNATLVKIQRMLIEISSCFCVNASMIIHSSYRCLNFKYYYKSNELI